MQAIKKEKEKQKKNILMTDFILLSNFGTWPWEQMANVPISYKLLRQCKNVTNGEKVFILFTDQFLKFIL